MRTHSPQNFYFLRTATVVQHGCLCVSQQGVGARFAGTLIDVAIALLLAHAIWELITVVDNRQVAIERAETSIDSDAQVMCEGS